MDSIFSIHCILIAHWDKMSPLPLIYSFIFFKYIYTEELFSLLTQSLLIEKVVGEYLPLS